MILTKDFYQKPTIEVAQSLLGKYLIHHTNEGHDLVGRIAETEAYILNDPASHAYRGQTQRNSPMYRSAGVAYIYFIYGKYHCFNIVTQKEGIPEAVLIRSIQPIDGIEYMMKLRGWKGSSLADLANGPAKLVQAMSITPEYNFHDITFGSLVVTDGYKSFGDIYASSPTIVRPRIGVKNGSDLLLRFYKQGDTFISSP